METLEELRAIVQNAPDGADHYGHAAGFVHGVYMKNTMGEVRSLSDIKRIIELMELRKKANKAYKSIETTKQRYNAENKIAREALKNLINTCENNTGNEPSLSCYYRALDEAKDVLK